MNITDEQWVVVEPLIGEMPRRADGRGRPWRSSREVLNGILWILRTGAQWADLPERYPPYQTCHRRFQRWVREGVFERILEALAQDLKERGKLDLDECFIDGTFIVAKKGADAWERPSGAKVRSSWAKLGNGRPLWSSSRRLCRFGCASRGHARRTNPRLPLRR
jgi:transposase